MARSAQAPTVYDVARLAGVSQATVSYVVNGRRNGKARISDETRERVTAAMAELGYVPNDTARSLRRQRTDRVCVLVSRLGSPYVDAMVDDIQRAVAGHGFSTVIAVGGAPERERQVLEQLHRRLADGAIVDAPSVDTAALARLASANVAIVALSNHLEPDGFDVIRTTEAAACDEAMDHLLARGHRRIAFLRHAADPGVPDPRFDSYRRALAAAGLPLDEGLIRSGAASRHEAYGVASELLEREERPTAIFSSSDIGALSAIWAAEAAGLRVPDEVAVLGVGNIPEGAIARPPLTTVGPEAIDFAGVADLLLSRLAGQAPATGRVLVQPWSFIRRASA